MNSIKRRGIMAIEIAKKLKIKCQTVNAAIYQMGIQPMGCRHIAKTVNYPFEYSFDVVAQIKKYVKMVRK